MNDGDLEIPASNREIAIHLNAIREDVSEIHTRIDKLENRRSNILDRILSSFILPVITGLILALVLK